MITFKAWFEGLLAWYLKQRPEGTSEATPYQRLDADTAMTVLNIILSDLAVENPGRYTRTITYIFDEDTNRLHLPPNVLKLLAFASSGYDMEPVPADTDLGAPIRKLTDDILWNDNQWAKNEQIRLHVLERPPLIKAENDIIRFPMEYLDLLNFRVIDRVKIQSGEPSTLPQNSEYGRLYARWIRDTGRIGAEKKVIGHVYTGIGR